MKKFKDIKEGDEIYLIDRIRNVIQIEKVTKVIIDEDEYKGSGGWFQVISTNCSQSRAGLTEVSKGIHWDILVIQYDPEATSVCYQPGNIPNLNLLDYKVFTDLDEAKKSMRDGYIISKMTESEINAIKDECDKIHKERLKNYIENGFKFDQYCI